MVGNRLCTCAHALVCSKLMTTLCSQCLAANEVKRGGGCQEGIEKDAVACLAHRPS